MPKLKTLQIVWHEKEPVYSLDFHPDGTLATAGGDKEIKLWNISKTMEGYAEVSHKSSLSGHTKTVNCVRFSPDGNTLISGGDGGELLLWTPKDHQEMLGNLLTEDERSAEWKRSAVLRGHTDDVMDVCWSNDGTAILSGSIDNRAIVWEVTEPIKGKMLCQLSNHKHFVQGVAWDPHQQYAITQSADRTCKLYALRPPAAKKRKNREKRRLPASAIGKEFYLLHTMSKTLVVADEAGNDRAQPQRQALFHDESMPSFFRRPAWSPDGAFVVVPAGLHKPHPDSNEVHTAFLYARGKWTKPIAHLPSQPKPVVCVKFCPVLFESDGTGAKPFQLLPYKMVFAVATLDSVVLYDTSSPLPIATFCQIHFDTITDLTWSCCGSMLAISSRDCFCSIITFEACELGKPFNLKALPPHIRDVIRNASEEKCNSTAAKGFSSAAVASESREQKINELKTAHVEFKVEKQVEVSTAKESKKVKRITPVPISKIQSSEISIQSSGSAILSGAQLRPDSESTKPTPVAQRTEPTVQLSSAVGSIAALAAAAGKQAATPSEGV